MNRLLGRAFYLVSALSGMAIASVPRGSWPHALIAGAAMGLALGLGFVRQERLEPVSRLDLIAMLLPLAFFVPVLTLPVAPGADMAMHVALGRGLAAGGAALSPAWGNVSAPLYPRGFSAVVALASPWFGFARAGLVAAGLSYVVVVFGIAAFLRWSLKLASPMTLAAVAVLSAHSPQSFFEWGGNPTAMAFGLSLFAVALLARVWNAVGEGGPRHVLAASLLLLGALSTHPTGALAGLTAIAALPVQSYLRRLQPSRQALAATAAALAIAACAALALKLGGPTVSSAEHEWISNYQRSVEGVLRGPRVFFFLRVWREIPRVLGWPWTTATIVAASTLLLLTRDGKRRVLAASAAILALGGLFAIGPWLPGIGVLVYPGRFTPLFLLITVPLIGWAVAVLFQRSKTIAWVAVASLFAIAARGNVRSFQKATPIATWNDLEAISCVGARVPPGDVVQGAYGDATQWIPALTGRAVTAAHPHITLNDEILAQRMPEPTFLFLGERLRYGEPVNASPPASEPICRAGKAALYKLK